MVSEWTRKIRAAVGGMSTASIIRRYPGMNEDGRAEARRVLARRRVPASKLPYKKRSGRKSSGFGFPF